MSYLQVKNLAKSFSGNPVFRDISFDINQGEFVSLLGASGCGKSTLLRSLSGLTPLDRGQMILAGQDMTTVAPKDRKIGMMFQSYALFPNMTVWQNIAYGLKVNGKSKDEIQSRVKQVIELVELKGKESAYPHSLSGGQKQRVALARTLVVHPKLLLLDEPFSALDAKIRRQLRDQMLEIQKELNITTILVTHDQEEALALSDRILLMEKGQIIQSGNAESIYTAPASTSIAQFIGNFNILNKHEAEQFGLHQVVDQVAIRPESIYIIENDIRIRGEGYSDVYQATVKKRALLGNIIRYQVESNSVLLTVDTLFRNTRQLHDIGSSIEICLATSEVKQVS
ncbi:ABC transporter ATP-binding protein [Vibrio sp. S4M6]|uniref:ABC transporter ATP-binding protein n=1 Tax=Vibrio sinus TaxID=2946865 RepID=UPI002029C171|nr:ABC transporter ATP-binding protein [Vibrio sinus]MCL9780254.1 ABC transporter ATP-binding protein [Vibrio sinus]